MMFAVVLHQEFADTFKRTAIKPFIYENRIYCREIDENAPFLLLKKVHKLKKKHNRLGLTIDLRIPHGGVHYIVQAGDEKSLGFSKESIVADTPRKRR